MNISATLRRKVTVRADDRCEYCGLSQAGQEARFHVDHVAPLAAGGATELSNLALACVSCSLRKGARQRVTDPLSGAHVAIFNPRTEPWSEHFRWSDLEVVGLTACGRATLTALQMNRPLALAIRAEEALLGRHPPLP